MAAVDEEIDKDGVTEVAGESDEERRTAEQEEADAWTPPTQAEFKKLKREAARAAKDLEKYKAHASNSKTDDDVEAATAKVREETEAKYKSKVVKAEARALLTAAGAKGDLAVLVRMIDLDDVDVDDDGEIDGLDSQIDDLKSRVPDLFDKKVRADSRTKADASDKAPAPKSETSTDRIARLMRSGKTN